jgi:hypothetical protein
LMNSSWKQPINNGSGIKKKNASVTSSHFGNTSIQWKEHQLSPAFFWPM